jgi:hypothetical protein
MSNQKIYRQIDVFDKKTERLIKEIELNSFDLELMKSRFNVPIDDPLMYYQYEIDLSKVDLFSSIEFNFKKHDYFLACFRGLTKHEREILTINKYCKSENRKRLIGLMTTNRSKFRETLPHFDSLDLSLFDNLIKNEKTIIKSIATKLGIEKVQIISENSGFDRKIMDLEECMDIVLSSGFGNLLIFGDSDFVYYEGEGKNNRWISK